MINNIFLPYEYISSSGKNKILEDLQMDFNFNFLLLTTQTYDKWILPKFERNTTDSEVWS